MIVVARVALAFALHLLHRIKEDRLTVTAGSLAYVTLLSLVPLLTVVLTTLSASPVFAAFGELIQNFVIDNFVPAAGQVVSEYLDYFVSNAGRMTAVGVSALFVVAMMLIFNIDNAFNFIFRSTKKRRIAVSFSVYWMILTLGPVLVGSSLAISSYLGSLSLLGSEMATDALRTGLSYLPALMSLLAFTGLYLVVPNRKIQIKHAVIGALIATLLFEVSKKGFALYLAHFPSYQVIYGALAAIPILFVWVYLSWCIVLIGAEITASLSEAWRPLHLCGQAEKIASDNLEEKQNDSLDSAGQ
uniref:virulence factor BrkB family protein n=1 Tax=Thaumasiovibrio subtropicus TaxID=1891207 RepID=UPI0018643AD7|nr:virulence factor BrkB family protein [Thaumasiovibrio subtropicus]